MLVEAIVELHVFLVVALVVFVAILQLVGKLGFFVFELVNFTLVLDLFGLQNLDSVFENLDRGLLVIYLSDVVVDSLVV